MTKNSIGFLLLMAACSSEMPINTSNSQVTEGGGNSGNSEHVTEEYGSNSGSDNVTGWESGNTGSGQPTTDITTSGAFQDGACPDEQIFSELLDEHIPGIIHQAESALFHTNLGVAELDFLAEIQWQEADFEELSADWRFRSGLAAVVPYATEECPTTRKLLVDCSKINSDLVKLLVNGLGVEGYYTCQATKNPYVCVAAALLWFASMQISCGEEAPTACGNMLAEGAEECDDGNSTPGDGCEPDCTITIPVCTNGKLEDGEDCDDGNMIPDDFCTNECKVCFPNCGDGKLDCGEECDDGNKTNDDSCTNSCDLT